MRGHGGTNEILKRVCRPRLRSLGPFSRVPTFNLRKYDYILKYLCESFVTLLTLVSINARFNFCDVELIIHRGKGKF